MVDCCKHSNRDKKCTRKKDKKHLNSQEDLVEKNVEIQEDLLEIKLCPL